MIYTDVIKKKIEFLTIFTIIISSLLVSCSKKAEPQTLNRGQEFSKSEPTLKELATILPKGVIDFFSLDNEGHIFYLDRQNKVHKLDSLGNEITSFGGLGSGPGEIRYSSDLLVNGANVYLLDFNLGKCAVYSLKGKYKYDKYMNSSNKIQKMIGLNDSLIAGVQMFWSMEKTPTFTMSVSLFNDSLKFLKTIYQNQFKHNRSKAIVPYLAEAYVTSCNNKIYIYDPVLYQYRLNVYNFEGELLKVITKNFQKIEYTKKQKKRLLELTRRSNLEATSVNSFFDPLFYLGCGRQNYLWLGLVTSPVAQSPFVFDLYHDEKFVKRVKLKIPDIAYYDTFKNNFKFIGNKVYLNKRDKLKIYSLED